MNDTVLGSIEVAIYGKEQSRQLEQERSTQVDLHHVGPCYWVDSLVIKVTFIFQSLHNKMYTHLLAVISQIAH